MRRRTILSFILIAGFLAMLGMAPAMLARQGQEPDWSEIQVGCGVEFSECPEVDGNQTYTVGLSDSAYFPEIPYPETMVVKVMSGTLAFRTSGPGVVVEFQRNELFRRVSDVPLPFGTPANTLNPLPNYDQGDALNSGDCSNSQLGTECILNPAVFADEMTFVELLEGDIVYVPANSTCFFCNITGIDSPGTVVPGNNAAVVQVWAPGQQGTTWFDLSQTNHMQGQAPARLEGQKLHDVSAWMLNPGSPCH